MAVDEPDTIDIVATAPDGTVSLVISDHLEWDGSLHHQYVLQDKLNAYLRFFESGEMYTKFPNSRGQWPSIEIFFQHEPDEEGRMFLDRAAAAVESAGLSLKHRMYKESSSAD
jgi:hypothetical protein